MSHIMDNNDHVIFREKCQKILDVLGTPSNMGRKYEDEKVTISSGQWAQGLSLEVTIMPKAHPYNLHNPCVMVTENGECIRHQGEWTYIEEHIGDVYEEAQREAISLGLG